MKLARIGLGIASLFFVMAAAQTANQPRVAPAPGEPDWVVVLRERYGLKLFEDLLNPVRTTAVRAPGLFRKAGPGPVKFTPMIALGLETRTRGGWYPAVKSKTAPRKVEIWSYVFKNTTDDLKNERNLPPPLEKGASVSFDPGEGLFGLWVSNDGFDDGGVYSEPGQVAAHNKRLMKQPYKAMIYSLLDKATGKPIPGRLVVGWEYSTNDDFQDVVCEIENATLVID